MTAEVAVLNSSAIALAADSAMTVGTSEGSRKTYNVNKLFRLSKTEPVGMMVFANAQLMWMPWETIIKQYRQQLGHQAFATIEDYSKDFLSFLETSNLFTIEHQQRYVELQLWAYFKAIAGRATERIRHLFARRKTVGRASIRKVFEDVIVENAKQLAAFKTLSSVPADFDRTFMQLFRLQLANAKHVFKSGLTRNAATALKEIAINLFIKSESPFGNSGVVFAGFGTRELFPAVRTFHVAAVLGKHVMVDAVLDKTFDETTNRDMPFSHTAIIPLAQVDVVETFVEGISNAFKAEYMSGLHLLITACLKDFINRLPASIDKQKFESDSLSFAVDQFKQLQSHLSQVSLQKHIQPLLNVVGVLPKDELAKVASALVELTSMKRKMSPEMETVGGPIDVAVISKGDGFVWISRKHYFKQDLNIHFAANYLREAGTRNDH